MFDRTAHMRRLATDPKRIDALRRRVCVKWTPEMDAKLVEMSNERLGIREISNAIGVGKRQARARRNHLGLPKGKHPGPKPKPRQPAGTVVVRLLEN